MKCFLLYTHTLLSSSVVHIQDFTLLPQDISQIKDFWLQNHTAPISDEELKNEIKFAIGLYYWCKQNLPAEYLKHILSSSITSPVHIIYEIMKNSQNICHLIYNNTTGTSKPDFTPSHEYECLILTGIYTKEVPTKKTFENLMESNFIINTEKYKNYKAIKIQRIFTTRIPAQITINTFNKTFKYLLQAQEVYALTFYHMTILAFDNEYDAQVALNIYRSNRNIPTNLLQNLLASRNIKYNLTTNSFNREELPMEVLNIINTQSLQEPFLLGHQLVILHSKENVRRMTNTDTSEELIRSTVKKMILSCYEEKTLGLLLKQFLRVYGVK